MLNRLRVPVVALFVAGLLACDDSTTEPPPGADPVLWSAELVAEEGEALAGVASVASTEDEVAATLEVGDGEEGAVHPWFIGAGDCGDEDARIGDPEDYPALEVNEAGEAVAEAELAVGLDPEGAYHVAVLASDEDDSIVACGVLTLED